MTTIPRTDSTPTQGAPLVRPGLVIAVLAAAGIVVSLAQTLVIPILGTLPQIFATNATNTSWIITITLLTGAISTPIAGRLADMYGKKRMMLIAIIPFIIGSVICAIAGDVVTMIVGRGLQGLASGLIPLGISLLHDILPKEKVGAAIALMSSSMGIGGALGLPIAAGVSQFASWRVLFWATGLAAVLVAVALIKVVPARNAIRNESRFDYVGAIGLAIGLTALLLAISKGSEWGWTSGLTLGCFVVAIVVLMLWGKYELGRRAPLVNLRTTVAPVVLLTNMASILIGFAMYAMNLIVPQVMQLPTEIGYGLGQNMVQMGLWLAPMGLGMMAVSKLGASISRTRGPRTTLIMACIVIAAGYGLATLVLATIGAREPGPANSTTILWTLILMASSSTITGCGIGFAYGAMPALIMGSVPASDKAAANGFNSLMRSLGTSVSSAVIGVVLASMVFSYGEHALPAHAGFVVSLLIGCVSAIVAALITAAIPRELSRAGR
ncbi:MFS transporter [Microbacterium sp. A93]|uniref:MFS transporter n=1 Tax=Microbacterium sp. A93 TaxID=3450716 RepID=UPI003F438526